MFSPLLEIVAGALAPHAALTKSASGTTYLHNILPKIENDNKYSSVYN